MATLMDSEQQAAQRERLSALMDGELDDQSVGAACQQWRQSEHSRSAWHAYHLIGDTLRSDDLGTVPARDGAFLDALRVRLAREPVVLAPQPLESVSPAAHRSGLRASGAAGFKRRSWLAPSAIAAGFMAVAAVLVLTGTPVTVDERVAGNSNSNSNNSNRIDVVATSARQGVAMPVAAAPSLSDPPGSGEPQAYVADGPLIRSARLDRYLSAHQQFAGSSALGVPSGFMRHATADAAPR